MQASARCMKTDPLSQEISFAGKKRTARGMELPLRDALVLAILFALAGCAGPGRIREDVSPFDGAQEISLVPAPVCMNDGAQPCFVRLGLYWRSTMNEGSVILIAVVSGDYPITDGESLHFFADGSFISVSSIDRKTRYAFGKGPHTSGTDFSCPTATCSVKRYLVDREILKQLISAKEASMSMDTSRGSIRGPLLRDNPGLALPAFMEFYEKVFGKAR